MQSLGERFGEAIGEHLEHDGVVIVVRGLEAPHPLLQTIGAYGERADPVGHAARLGRHEVGEA